MAAHNGKKGKRSARRRPRWVDTLVIVAGTLIAVGLMVWPWVLDQLNANGVFNKITEVSSQVSAMSPEERETYLEQARSYNEVLAGQEPELPADQIWPYDDQLTYNHDPMMSWLEIPSINVSMPIYHGTGEAALMAGVGHLEGTSLPTGGASTHTVLTAHSGMQNLTMFDDIGRLQPGDLVLLHTMDETLAYKMVSSEVVWPDEVDSLGIEEGQDLVTLVTCTPYGVNDHRLLVHCVRTDYDPDEAAAQSSPWARHWGMREWAVLVAALAVIALLLRAAAHHRRKKREAAEAALAASLKKDARGLT